MTETVKYYPPVGFHFRVSINPGNPGRATDTYFQSVSGLSVQVQTENWKEGGENRFEHTLPVRTKYSDLVLKRGLYRPEESDWTDWFKSTMELISAPSDKRSKPTRDLLIVLLDQNHKPLAQWTVAHAWPKNWKLNDMNAERSEVLIETLELNYNFFTYKKPEG